MPRDEVAEGVARIARVADAIMEGVRVEPCGSYRQGKPDKDISKAGVLIHQLDLTEDKARPWRPCSQYGADNWCAGRLH